MQNALTKRKYRSGWSLGEMIVALVIGAMVLAAILTVYSRANQAADAVLAKVEAPALAEEVLQLIAEDLDRVIGAEDDTQIEIKNGFDNGFPEAELVLRRTFADSKSEQKTFEEIVWRAGYDSEGTRPGMILYRSHEGVNVEDKLLESKREAWEQNYPFVPVCRGLTFFRIEILKDDDLIDRWSSQDLPPGVKVSISFAQPYETVRGTWDVLESERVSRTIAIDRIRDIRFAAAPIGVTDPNAPETTDTDEREPTNRTRN